MQHQLGRDRLDLHRQPRIRLLNLRVVPQPQKFRNRRSLYVWLHGRTTIHLLSNSATIVMKLRILLPSCIKVFNLLALPAQALSMNIICHYRQCNIQ